MQHVMDQLDYKIEKEQLTAFFQPINQDLVTNLLNMFGAVCLGIAQQLVSDNE